MRYQIISTLTFGLMGLASAASTTTTSAASSTTGSAVSLYPECAQSCLTKAIESSGCGASDSTCQCTSGLSTILKDGLTCLLTSSCSAADVQSAYHSRRSLHSCPSRLTQMLYQPSRRLPLKSASRLSPLLLSLVLPARLHTPRSLLLPRLPASPTPPPPAPAAAPPPRPVPHLRPDLRARPAHRLPPALPRLPLAVQHSPTPTSSSWAPVSWLFWLCRRDWRGRTWRRDETRRDEKRIAKGMRCSSMTHVEGYSIHNVEPLGCPGGEGVLAAIPAKLYHFSSDF